jgi:hypothetical protein
MTPQSSTATGRLWITHGTLPQGLPVSRALTAGDAWLVSWNAKPDLVLVSVGLRTIRPEGHAGAQHRVSPGVHRGVAERVDVVPALECLRRGPWTTSSSRHRGSFMESLVRIQGRLLPVHRRMPDTASVLREDNTRSSTATSNDPLHHQPGGAETAAVCPNTDMLKMALGEIQLTRWCRNLTSPWRKKARRQ